MNNAIHYDVTRFSDYDIHLFLEGSHARLYEKFGSHFMKRGDTCGVYFSVWAPNAKTVSVCGDFNNYDKTIHPLKKREDDSGIWECFVEDIEQGLTYKYHIVSNMHNIVHDKSDPFSFYSEKPSKSASRIWEIDNYEWQDKSWMKKRAKYNAHDAPINIYEVHLGSWRKKTEEDNRYLSYREMADELVSYLLEMNYTHVEFMPFTEYPYFGSWGYQVVGYFAATARFGEPQDLMYLIDTLHKSDIGVIMDWVPSHFAVDLHGLINFDGTALYEHADPKQGYHPEWGSIIFNYGRNEVRAFLISSAMFWLDKYHIDGIRVDAVASMLHLDYARKEGEWIANKYGGNENLEAVHFLKELNRTTYGAFPDILMIAEESTAWPMVTRPTDVGGLGFGLKWNMGWMHDSLKYLSYDPIYRQHYHKQLTFSMWYAYDENFLLPLSHDEVVHIKGSLINKMPGKLEDKFSNLRALYSYMIAHPGKKLMFMGGEIAQFAEWNYKESLDWHLLEEPLHKKLQKMVSDINALYRTQKALYQYDEKREGFEWINDADYQRNCISFIRKCDNENETILVVCNFSNQELIHYRVGVPEDGRYEEIFNSQSEYYGGCNIGNTGVLKARDISVDTKRFSISITLPPIGVLFFKKVVPVIKN
ncbi:1,4-alpha-glucan branching protein GlgB [Sulfurimonas sp. CS5]|jgi:1,4-alpha-glucan branching enzyme|uniref:1,4-alpha-glucan branching protein GlgB n=1 Tax=Sulfurimonas sp. CS5 TaxID=3391145 RepID=UPI0039E8EED6